MSQTSTVEQSAPVESKHEGQLARLTGKRLDIQGLRAVAVLAVVIDHVGLFGDRGGFVGVDVFFVISGFLITGHLVKGLLSDASVDFRDFYAARIRRLMPAASAVLLFTAVVTVLFLPGTRWREITWDILGSAFYVENWVLSANSVDYMTMDSLPSPLQHYWSLAVEEQFYIVWPIVIAAVGWLALLGNPRGSSRRRYIRENESKVRALLLVGLAAIALPSLAWSVYYSEANPAKAYFVTTTRLWELAIGGLVAIMAVHFAKLPSLVGALMMWSGLAGIMASFVLITPETTFPGYAALLPTVSTALVIIGGFTAGKASPNGLLSLPPVQAVGNWSYSIYLWHWPLIVIAMAQFGEISLPMALVMVALSLATGYASFRWIETPTRNGEWGMDFRQAASGASLMICVCAGVGVLVVGMAAYNFDLRTATDEVAAQQRMDAALNDDESDDSEEQEKWGAEVLPANPRDAKAGVPRDSFELLLPAPGRALEDAPSCATTPIGDPSVTSCQYGVAGASTRVALVGDSHAAQWLPALDEIATQWGWELTAYIHDSCPFAVGELERGGARYDDCIEWNSRVSALLGEEDLAAVIATNYTGSVAVEGGDVSDMASAHAAAWGPFIERDVAVVAIRDTPAPDPINVGECATLNGDKLTECSFDRAAASDRGLALMLAAESTAGVTAVDLNDAICPTARCAAAIGNVLVYRDTNHLTATYVRTLVPRLRRALRGLESLNAGPA